MMEHPYRESYLDEIAQTQGALFERLHVDVITPERLYADCSGLHDIDMRLAVGEVAVTNLR